MRCDGTEGKARWSRGRGLWCASLPERVPPLREALQGIPREPHQSPQCRSGSSLHDRSAARAASQSEHRGAAGTARRTGSAAAGASSRTRPEGDPTRTQ